MKATVRTSRTAGQLEKMFRALNSEFFAGELPEPIITLKKTPGAYGHITCGKTWKAGTEQMKVSDLASVVTSNVNICLHYADKSEVIGYAPDFYSNHTDIGFMDLQIKKINGEEKTCLFVYVMPIL